MTKQEKSWILYDWAMSAYSVTITSAVFPIFFKDFAAAGMAGFDSTAILGYGNSIASIVIAVLAPILGTIADYRNAKKRFFLSFAGLAVAATLSFVWIGEGQWLRGIVLYIASALGFAGANIFYDSLLVDVTEPEKMDWISSAGYGYGYIGGAIPFVVGMSVIILHEQLGFASSVGAVRLAFVLTGVWWIVFSVPIIRNVRQRYYIEPSPTPIRDSWPDIPYVQRNQEAQKAFVFLLAYFFYIDGVDTIIKMATAFGTDIGMSFNMLLIILFAVQVVSFPCALIYGRLAKRYSARKMLLVGIGVYLVITVTAFFLPRLPSVQIKVVVFWAMSMLVASSQGGIQALSRSFYGKLVPKDRSAEFFGFYNIFGKFAAIIGPFLVGFFSQRTQDTGIGVLSLIILFVTGGVILTRVNEKEEA